MRNQTFPVAGRVRVISYGPFRGLKGTIQSIHCLPPLEGEEAFCFYRIELEGAHIQEPIWFEQDEVEIISPHQESNSLPSA